MPSKLFTDCFPEALLTEDSVDNCERPVRCTLCTGSNFVPADGPASFGSRGILFIGESPSEDEDMTCKPFMKTSGQEFNERYLPLAGLTRDEITLTNVVKCCPPGKRTPAPSQIRSCAESFLIHEIMCMNPTLIVPMGGVALRFINTWSKAWEKRAADPKNLNLEAHHGRLFLRVFPELGEHPPIPVFPIYHPAAGLRDGSKMTFSFEDFRILGEYLRGKNTAHVEDPYPAPIYTEVQDLSEYMDYWKWSSVRAPFPYAAIDTEDDIDGRFYSIQISHSPGSAVFIDGKNDKLIKDLTWFLFPHPSLAYKFPQFTFIFHYYFHDGQALYKQLRWKFPDDRVADTLQEAFQSGRLPKKLKALAYRLCGVNMTPFRDLVYPYSVAKAVDFLKSISAHELLAPAPCYGKKGQLLKKTTPNPVAADINRMLRCITNTLENPDEDAKPYDVWKKWKEFKQKVDSTEPLESGAKAEAKRLAKKAVLDALVEHGFQDLPKFSIRYVPRDLAIQYGCRDADVTGRVFLRLRELAEADRLIVSESVIRKDWITS